MTRPHLRCVALGPVVVLSLAALVGGPRTVPATLTATVVPASPPSTVSGPPTSGIEQAELGVVMLFAAVHPTEVSAGTAIVVSPDGPDSVAITNAHVVRGARVLVAHDAAGGHDYPGAVLGTDDLHDIAVIRLRGAGKLPAAVMGDSDTLRIGQPVTAVGNVGGTGVPTASEGVITALDRRVNSRDANGGHLERLRDMIETDAWVRPGDSGGPLVAASGQVIGVDTSADGRHGYAIRINAALAYAHALAEFSLDRPNRSSARSVDDQSPDQRPEGRGLLDTQLQLGSAPRAARQPVHRPRRRALLSHVIKGAHR